MRMLHLAAALALLLGMTAQAGALEAVRAPVAFGGTGEDALQELAAGPEGLFAAGSTASADYDLSMRTRTGETGWALRLGGDGAEQFTFCSGRAGMTRMRAPAAYEDGAHSLVLTDETMQRGEWILVDARGKRLESVAIDSAGMLCEEGGQIAQFIPLGGADGARLAVLLRHGDGTCCCAALSRDGGVQRGAPFPGGEFGLAAGQREETAYACMDAGALRIRYLAAQEALTIALAKEQRPATMEDMLLGGDESAAICGALAGGGGYLLRVSRAGELLFFLKTDAPATRLDATDTGYAVLAGERVLFADEDGAHIVWADAPADALDLAKAPGGAAVLSRVEGRGRRQALITWLAQPAFEEAPEPAVQQTVDAERTMAAADGSYLLCSAEDAPGVRVRHVDAAGREIFSVRTPIHTAADSLEWLCAAKLADGGVLLGGRYLYGAGETARQEGVIAHLSSGGVLLRMHTLAGAGAVCAIAMQDDGHAALHVARGDSLSAQADAAMDYEVE